MSMKLDVTVPSSLKDIQLKDYQKFIKIAIDKEVDDITMRQSMVQIFCKIPLIAVYRMSRKDFMEISGKLLNILQEKPKLTHTVNLGGIDYGFIPNLDKDLSLGEFVDLDSYMTNWDNFHKAMAVLYRPITNSKKDSYTIKDYDSDEVDASVMMHISMEVAMGAVLFFWNLSNVLLKITPKYLQQVLEKNPKAVEALGKNGVGISTFTNSLEEACSKLERLVPYTLALRSYS